MPPSTPNRDRIQEHRQRAHDLLDGLLDRVVGTGFTGDASLKLELLDGYIRGAAYPIEQRSILRKQD